MTCKVCGVGKTVKYGKECVTCIEMKNFLLNSGKSRELVSKLYKVKIVYDIEDCSHDGYCSDPGDLEIENSEKTLKLPLFEQFENLSTDEMLENNHFIKLYSHKIKHDGAVCCGAYKKYTIKTIEKISI